MGKKVGGALLGAVISVGIGLATGGLTWAAAGSAFLRQFATNAVLGFVAGALAPKPPSAAQLAGTTVATRSPVASRKIVYGRARTSGTIVFLEVTGEDSKYLHHIVTLAGHEINAVESVWFNDAQASDGAMSNNVEEWAYSGYANITAHFGSPTQTYDTNLESRTTWTSSHHLKGVAYLYTRLIFDEDKYATGMPNISAIIEGKKVYDPRTTSTAYSNNAALCILDYLRDDIYGLGASDDEIDFASFITAANICDEDGSDDPDLSEKRYTINGVIDTARAPSQILQEMASACAGTVYYSNGKWHIKAGAYITPTDTLTVDDFVGSIDITTRVTNQSNFNAVKGVFISPDDGWQPVDFPALISSTFENEDGGERRYADMTMPLTTSSTMAQRLAKIALYRNREQLTVSVPCKLTAFKYDIGDTVMVTHSRMGWTNKVFEVVGWQYGATDVPSVNLSLKETSADVYDWSLSDETALTRNNATLPNPFVVAAITNLSVTQLASTANDGNYQSAIVVSWDKSADGFVTSYEVQWKRTTAPAETYFNSVITKEQQYVIPNALVGTHTVKVRAINTMGVRSAWVEAGIDTVADTTAPSVPSNMNSKGGFRLIEVTWTNPTEYDLDLIDVYRNTTNNSATAAFVGSTKGTTYTDTDLGINETYYYWTKAKDRTGNASAFSSVTSATTEFVDSADFSSGVYDLFADAGMYGIEPVSSLPATGDFTGQQVFLTTDGKLYQWNGSAWALTIADVADSSITASKIVANTITGGLLATSGIITDSAQLDNAVITNAKIANAAVDTLKVAGAAITAASYSSGIDLYIQYTQEKTGCTSSTLSYPSSGNAGITIFCSANVLASGAATDATFRVYRNGTTLVGSRNFTAPVASGTSAVAFIYDSNPGTNPYYVFKIYNANVNDLYALEPVMVVMGGKR